MSNYGDHNYGARRTPRLPEGKRMSSSICLITFIINPKNCYIFKLNLIELSHFQILSISYSQR